MWLSLAVRTVLAAIKTATKDKKKRAKYRSVLLTVRDAINDLYAPQTQIVFQDDEA